MIVLTLYVALVSHPPLGMALRETVFPAILTLRQSPLLLAVLSGLHQLCGCSPPAR